MDLSRSSPPEKLALASCLAAILLLPASKRLEPPSAPKRVGVQCLSPSPPPLVTATPGPPEQGLRQGLLLMPWQVLAVGLWGRRLHPPQHPLNSLVGSQMLCSRCDTLQSCLPDHPLAVHKPCLHPTVTLHPSAVCTFVLLAFLHVNFDLFLET